MLDHFGEALKRAPINWPTGQLSALLWKSGLDWKTVVARILRYQRMIRSFVLLGHAHKETFFVVTTHDRHFDSSSLQSFRTKENTESMSVIVIAVTVGFPRSVNPRARASSEVRLIGTRIDLCIRAAGIASTTWSRGSERGRARVAWARACGWARARTVPWG